MRDVLMKEFVGKGNEYHTVIDIRLVRKKFYFYVVYHQSIRYLGLGAESKIRLFVEKWFNIPFYSQQFQFHDLKKLNEIKVWTNGC
jgi:hypothetical protein